MRLTRGLLLLPALRPQGLDHDSATSLAHIRNVQEQPTSVLLQKISSFVCVCPYSHDAARSGQGDVDKVSEGRHAGMSSGGFCSPEPGEVPFGDLKSPHWIYQRFCDRQSSHEALRTGIDSACKSAEDARGETHQVHHHCYCQIFIHNFRSCCV